MKYKKEDLMKLEDLKYNVRQGYVFFILGFYSEKSDKPVEILKNIMERMYEFREYPDIISNLSSGIIEKITNEWSLTFEQIIAYAFIIFSNLTECGKMIKTNDILDEYNCVMRLYTPEQAVNYFDQKIPSEIYS